MHFCIVRCRSAYTSPLQANPTPFLDFDAVLHRIPSLSYPPDRSLKPGPVAFTPCRAKINYLFQVLGPSFAPAMTPLAHFLTISPRGERRRMKRSTEIKDIKMLPQDMSHILIEVPPGGLGFDPLQYLSQKGVRVEEAASSSDKRGRNWLILSIRSSDVSQLVLELIERGLSSNIQGINARKSRMA